VLIPEGQLRLWLYVPATDLRKSFDGLSALVRTKLAEDPLSGQLFVFLNRRRTQLKILYFDRSGYCVWAKRLEQGRFHSDMTDTTKQRLSWSELQLILEGIDTRSVRRFKRFSLPLERVCGVS
jgi:transposase